MTNSNTNKIICSYLSNDIDFDILNFMNRMESKENMLYELAPPPPYVEEENPKTLAIKSHLKVKKMMGQYNGITFWGILPESVELYIYGFIKTQNRREVIQRLHSIFFVPYQCKKEHRIATERLFDVIPHYGGYSSVFGNNYSAKFDRFKEQEYDRLIEEGNDEEFERPRDYSDETRYLHRRCVINTFGRRLADQVWDYDVQGLHDPSTIRWDAPSNVYTASQVEDCQGGMYYHYMRTCNDFHTNHEFNTSHKNKEGMKAPIADWGDGAMYDRFGKCGKAVNGYYSKDFLIPNRAWTIKQLKSFLKQNGRKTTGQKEELFQRAYRMK